MREGSRSGNRPERGPYGCLIVKKKGSGVSGGGDLGKGKNFESKVNKRPRLILDDSESSDEDLLVSNGRKLNARDANVPLVVKSKVSHSVKREEEIEVDMKRRRRRRELVKCRESTGIAGKRFIETAIGRKRSHIHTLNYSEDEEYDESLLKKEHFDDDDDEGACIGRSNVMRSSLKITGGKFREFETECSRGVKLRKREHFPFGRNSAFSDEQDHRTDLKDKQKFGVAKDGSFHSDGSLTEKFGSSCSQPIRVQGKNGVLKVMLNSKNKLGASEKNYDHREAGDPKKASKYTNASNWEATLSPTLYSEQKFHGRSRSVAVAQKNKVNAQNDSSGNSESQDNKAETSNRSLLMGSKSVATSGSKKGKKSKGKSSLTSEPNVSIRCKEGEVRRGSGTEKQLLRERIRHLLLDAGWTIDFRPRKNRNYQDAVYINPSGTEYWSIIKAYDALKKQFDDDIIESRNRVSSLFTPIPEELLSQLTRQTRKKMEREKITKQKGHKRLKTSEKKFQKKHIKVSMGCNGNGKELDSFTKKDDKLLKFRIKGNNAIVLKTRKSSDLSNDAGFGEGECLLQVEGTSSGTLQKERKKSSDVNSLQGRKHKKQPGRGLLVRSSNKGENSDDDDFVPYSGKRTVLSWLIDMGTVPMSGKVQYMNKRRTRTMLEGWITKDGIHCGCCSKILTVSKFEIHAGSKLRQPFQYIFLEDGVSLLQCHIDAWTKQEKPESSGFCLIDCDHDDPNDDTCAICGDGGDLICCDGCPSTFHQSCLDIQIVPAGDWHCPNCSCKFCRGIGGTAGQGTATALSLRTCSLCEEKYHQLCCQDMDTRPVDPFGSTSFCGQSCKKIFQKLQKFLGIKQELDAGFSWTLVQRSNLDNDTFNHSLPQKAECNSKLAVALSVMDECFLPIIDRRSGINLINGVLYNCGSNFSRLNFSGFYTVVLERGDEIISAASIRIHGSKLAEMPFIGTRHIYRRQGMCRRLLNAIESVLRSLNVEKLVIPAISDLMHTWTKVFNFKPLEESHKQEMRSMNILVFPATGLLQKQLLTHNLTRGNMSDISVVRTIELESNYHLVTKNASKSDIGSSEEPDVHCSDEEVIHHPQGVNNEIALPETSPRDTGGSSCDDISNMISSGEPIFHATGTEYAPDAKLLLHSSVTHDDEFKLKNEHMPNSSSESKLLSSEEDVVNDAHGINVEIADGNPEFHNSESSLQNWTIKNIKYLEATCGSNVQSANRNVLQFNSDMAQHEVQEVERNSDEVCHFVSDVSVCEEHFSCSCAETMDQDSCGLKSEALTILPDEIKHDKDCIGCPPDVIAQLQDAAPAISSQGSDHNDLHQDSEGADQPHRISDYIRESSLKTLVHHHDSCMPQNVQQCVFANASEPGSHRAEGEVATGVYDLQVTGKDSAESTSNMEEAGDCNIHNLACNSDAAFTDGSILHVSDQENMLDTCNAKVGVGFVDPSHHIVGRASAPNFLDSTTEPNLLGSHLNNRIFILRQLPRIPDLISDLAHSVPCENNHDSICCTELNCQASAVCNVPNMHNLQEEVSSVDPGAISLDQDYDASKVNKSVDTSESIFSSCSRECLV